MLYNKRATDKLKARPNCQMGDGPAAVDAKTEWGPWGYMCIDHHKRHGFGLGEGVGQVLLCGDELDEQLKIHYELEQEARPYPVVCSDCGAPVGQPCVDGCPNLDPVGGDQDGVAGHSRVPGRPDYPHPGRGENIMGTADDD